MNARSLFFSAALVAAGLSAPATAQTFINIPDASQCSDMTPDGSLVVGTGSGGGFYWNYKLDPAPTYIGGISAVAVSDDGTKILGSFDDPPGSGDSYAGIWTQAGGWVSLGNLASCGFSNSSPGDLSGDGNVAVGGTWAGCSGRGFRWTAATGMEYLAPLGNGQNNARVVNNDGSVIGGFAQGNSSRTPAIWSGDLTGFVYDMAALGEVQGMNNDGSTLLGSWNGGAFINDGVSFNVIGSNISGWTGNPQDITEDGGLVVGHDSNLLARSAWVYELGSGFTSMDDVVANAGVVGAPEIFLANAVSDDGNVIVGQSANPNGLGWSAYIFEFNTTGSWVDLGSPLAGTLGEPNLVGSGDLLPFASVSVSLTNAIPGGNAYLILGFLGINAPFKGGTLIPTPDMILGPLGIDGAGNLDLSTFWPAGLPAGFETYYQYWMPDAAGPKGYAASNGLKSITP